ncbi:MAG: helix-turn-helix transcriptional regulator [Planctomycetes bacterium]|nr:helix-turn-helix transcriptional regulator [Planctomycetota bacterium]
MAQVWDSETVAVRNLGVSERQPLLVARTRHGEPTPFHSDTHFELEIGVVISGRTQRQIGGCDRVLGPGEVWLCGMWEPHRYRVVTAPNDTIVMVIRPQMLVDLRFDEDPDHRWLMPFTVPPEHRPRPSPAVRPEILAWAGRMRRTIGVEHPRRALMQRVLLLELLLLLDRDWEYPRMRERVPARVAGVDQAVELVFAHPAGITSADAARRCGFTRNRFSQLFTELMGVSFAKFSLRYRLSGVASRLVRTPDPLKAIAPDWGFTDASHLLRCFKKQYGCTPMAYRRARGQMAG